MTDATSAIPVPHRPAKTSLLTVTDHVRRRNRAENRLKYYGLAAITVSLLTLAIMLWTIFSDGIQSFFQASFTFPVELSADVLDKSGNRDRAEMMKVTTIGYATLIDRQFVAAVKASGVDTQGLSDKQIAALISREAPGNVRAQVLDNPALVGTTTEFKVLATGRVDGFLKGRVTEASVVNDSNINPAQIRLARQLDEAGLLTSGFNWDFITSPDASDQRPEAAGMGVAIIGSAYMMLMVLVFTLPVGVAASIYLEEFAPKNRITDLIEVNISNLAAVPSIVFGILGLAIFINFMGLPQSSTLVGALVISLMTLPTIIIATRASIRAVPPSIRDAALGIGASKMQTVFHHVLPLAMPGILTGTILGLASALGETAPLLLIGMVAFVDNYPSMPVEGFLDPATALPVQVYGWAQRADPAFIERSSGAIIVLLIFLVLMNAVAIILRRRFERRW